MNEKIKNRITLTNLNPKTPPIIFFSSASGLDISLDKIEYNPRSDTARIIYKKTSAILYSPNPSLPK